MRLLCVRAMLAIRARMIGPSSHASRWLMFGGMTRVKERLELAFLAPLRNPRLRDYR